MITLTEFIIDKQRKYPGATGQLTRLLNDIGIAGKIVNREINRAGLSDIHGYHGTTNIQGETQKKLDIMANDTFIDALRSGGECCAIASEENEKVIEFDNDISQQGTYVVAIDPLDGSSNIEANVSIGTIFSIYKRKSPVGPGHLSDLLRKGTELVGAGYLVYGSSTMLVFSTGNGVNGFTLEPSLGLYILSHPNMKLENNGSIYSINEGNSAYMPEGMIKYLEYCKEEDKETQRPYSARYVGSMVADYHRTLINGGIFMYPASSKIPNGKLRLLYESNPVAYLTEQAGGKASTGFSRILEIEPISLHQRSPIIAGCTEMVEKAEEFMQKYSPGYND